MLKHLSVFVSTMLVIGLLLTACGSEKPNVEAAKPTASRTASITPMPTEPEASATPVMEQPTATVTVTQTPENACSDTPPKTLVVGKKAAVNRENSTNKVRETPAGKVLDAIRSGEVVTVTEGPQCAKLDEKNYLWWKIESATGLTGWVAEGDFSGENGAAYYNLVDPATQPFDAGMPKKPGGLRNEYTCTATDATIVFTWADMSSNEDGFRLYRNDNLVATIAADTESASDTIALSEVLGGTITYSVVAYNSVGESERSSWVAANINCVIP